MVMTGVRISVGEQDPMTAPGTVEIFGRLHSLHCSRGRWFDFPFTREESILAEKTVTLNFTSSDDGANGMTILDGIKVGERCTVYL